MGEASRNLHNWARQYQANLGMEDRLTLLNNWENGKQYSGDYLMKIGLNVFSQTDGTSHVLVLE